MNEHTEQPTSVTTTVVGSPAAAPKLFKLSEREAAERNRQFDEHQARQSGADAAQQQALAQRKALFDQLLKEYPPEEGARVWRHAHLGEAKYIEVAVSGGYFDPRAEPRDKRPDLDIPDFDGASRGAAFSMPASR